MRAGGGKSKGSAFERECCVTLSLWISNGAHKDLLWRSAMSGGRATVRGLDVRQAGDIASVAPEGHIFTNRYLIECKFYRDLDLASFILFQRGKLHGFWKKLSREAVARNKFAMLIAKQNYIPAFIVTDCETYASAACAVLRKGFPHPVYVMLLTDMLGQPFKAQINGRKRTYTKPATRRTHKRTMVSSAVGVPAKVVARNRIRE